MERLSIFDIYKIGVGPSSSHTLGPWKAANRFALGLVDKPITSLQVRLFGSLSKTGVGHGTDIAVMLGLQSFDPETIDTTNIDAYIQKIRTEKKLRITGADVDFNPALQIIYEKHALPYHPNALTFRAEIEGGDVVEETYYSIGGGFITQGKEKEGFIHINDLPFPVESGSDLIAHTETTGQPISGVVMRNELYLRNKDEIRAGVLRIFDTMLECVYQGCHSEGILPGGLNVKKRAKALCDRLLDGRQFDNIPDWLEAIKTSPHNFSTINKWISCFALAVNEENASLGRVVTSPTNGAAGVIPAVLMYYYCFCDYKGEDDILNFILTSGEIGCIFKKRATISAAVGGCQAEIGVSSAMAAGALTELLGGDPEQVLMAAEIAMEHHLGLTCDPIGGLVQIPCIERNTMGAIKAITASHLAMEGNPKNAIVNFDMVVKTMWDTAQDMHEKYKETAEGGLAFNLPVVLPNC
ncbi:MAG: L-serine ammonia-lyase [Saprospiraceae bacterium]|nr:L-serine ammonia-lyase [Saprospiraceae bacterium]